MEALSDLRVTLKVRCSYQYDGVGLKMYKQCDKVRKGIGPRGQRAEHTMGRNGDGGRKRNGSKVRRGGGP